jgi:hypothetical protein
VFYSYEMQRSDLRALFYVMNHCVSYAIISVGVFDMFAPRWLGTLAGAVAALS